MFFFCNTVAWINQRTGDFRSKCFTFIDAARSNSASRDICEMQGSCWQKEILQWIIRLSYKSTTKSTCRLQHCLTLYVNLQTKIEWRFCKWRNTQYSAKEGFEKENTRTQKWLTAKSVRLSSKFSASTRSTFWGAKEHPSKSAEFSLCPTSGTEVFQHTNSANLYCIHFVVCHACDLPQSVSVDQCDAAIAYDAVIQS